MNTFFFFFLLKNKKIKKLCSINAQSLNHKYYQFQMKLRGSLSTTIRLIGRHVEYMRKKFREKIRSYEEGYQSCLTAM